MNFNINFIRYKWISFVDGLEVDINEMRVDKLSMIMAVGLRLMLIADLVRNRLRLNSYVKYAYE